MAKGPDDTTDKLFPPPETTDVFPPLPAGRSIREEFIAHRRGITLELKEFRADIVKLLAAHGATKEPTAREARAQVTRGALATLKYGAALTAGAECLVQVLKVWRPELAGPVEVLVSFLRGG